MAIGSKQGVMGVEVGSGSLERAIRVLGKMTSSVISEYKRANDHYEKPSAKRHAKEQEIVRRRRREQEEAKDPNKRKRRSSKKR